MPKSRKPQIQTAEPDTRFIVDRVRNLVFDTQNPNVVAKIVQTQNALLRDDLGNVIGVEVLHHCVTPDGKDFILDESC